MAELWVSEIFYSLQGESRTVGWPTVFVRLTGCPLRCSYCDTQYAFKGGSLMALADVVAAVKRYPTHYITVTGGEPLAQKACFPLLSQLADLGAAVSLETSGALDVSSVDPRVSIVMDLKTPSSGEVGRNLYSNLQLLSQKDQLKFVIGDRLDYEWAKQQMAQYDLGDCCEILFSPVQGALEPYQLADWILADRLMVRFQLQLHKVLWGNEPGR